MTQTRPETRFDRRNRSYTLDGDGKMVRTNVTLPRELLAAYKAHLNGAPLSTDLAEMIRERLNSERPQLVG